MATSADKPTFLLLVQLSQHICMGRQVNQQYDIQTPAWLRLDCTPLMSFSSKSPELCFCIPCELQLMQAPVMMSSGSSYLAKKPWQRSHATLLHGNAA